jgi:hypothetical protein
VSVSLEVKRQSGDEADWIVELTCRMEQVGEMSWC